MHRFLPHLSLRVRITIWVVAIFAVVHITLSLIVILLYRQSVDDRIRSDLVDAAQAVAGETPAQSRQGLALQIVQNARAARWGPLACVVLDGNGTLLNTAGPYDPGVIEQLAEDARSHQQQDSRTVFDSADRHFIYAIAPLADHQRLLVAAPVGHTQRAVEPAMSIFLITLPVGLIAAGVTTWHMSKVAVRPLQQVQHFAEELSAENVRRSIDIDDASPETEELRLELEAAMERIGAGYEQQARFLANVSHELKTPISVVRTEAQVLLSGPADEKDLRDFARSTSEEMDRLGRMIESFLLLTRIRQGTALIRAKQHDANDILLDAVGHCTAMAKQYNVRLSPTLDASDEQPKVEGNADLIQTALGNLIRNAIRFSPQDQNIEVRCSQRNDQTIMSVRDYGPGIPDEIIGRIFEPFTQADDERRQARGTGLGLQIAQGIAELHGGEISVENTNPGCRFYLCLPQPHPEI